MKKLNLLLTLLIVTTASFHLKAQRAPDGLGNGHAFSGNIMLPSKSVNGTNSVSNFTVVHQVPAPTAGVNDITWDGVALWVASFGTNTIIRFSPNTGAVIKTIPTTSGYPNGLEFDGTNLWMTDNTNKTVQLIDTLNGAVLFSAPVPAQTQLGFSYCAGLTIQNNLLWINDPLNGGGSSSMVTQSDTLITVLNQYNNVSGYLTGLTFDGTNLWSSNNTNDLISKINPATYTVITDYNSPSSGGYANGLAWDGDHLWVSDNGVDSIYQVIPGTVGVNTPAPKTFSASVFPNPINDKGVLSYTSEKVLDNATLLIADATGKIAKQISLAGFSTVFSRASLSNGIYFYSLKADDKIMARGKITIID